ncbi:MAG: NUDIX domain-containing protein [Sphaerochaetaceae bacterium]|jgi:8-oxo-dGTP pyrophosphatase MutT (NUDIX family)
MRILFELDQKDYEKDWKPFIRPSARAIIIKGQLIYLVHSLVYDYYKFPGGGIDKGERAEAAIVREVREEAGLSVIESSIRPYGHVLRKQKGTKEHEIFIQDNLYYLCDVDKEPVSQDLDDYEAEECFTRVLVDPRVAIAANRAPGHGPKEQVMLEREARVLELLIAEGFFSVPVSIVKP